MRTAIKVEQSGLVRIKDVELEAGRPGDARNPLIMADTDCTLEYVHSALLGPTVLILSGEGDPVAAFAVKRPGTYEFEISEDRDHVEVAFKAPVRELVPA